MSRDYKTHPNSSAPAKSRDMLLLGLFAGFVLGLLSAIGIWMYISKGPSPFISPDKPDNMVSRSAGNQAQKAGSASSPTDKAKGGDGKPRFEFYKILPERRRARHGAAS